MKYLSIETRGVQMRSMAVTISGRKTAAEFAQFLVRSGYFLVDVYELSGDFVFIIMEDGHRFGGIREWLRNEAVTGWNLMTVTSIVDSDGPRRSGAVIPPLTAINGRSVDLRGLAEEAGASRNAKQPWKAASRRWRGARR